MKYEYLKEEEFVVFHEDDQDLDKITIPLPKLDKWYSEQLGREVSYEEALTFVDGYGLPPEDQVFKHQKWPDRLKRVYEIVFAKLRVSEKKAKYKDITDVDQQDIFNELYSNPEEWKEEIEWIKKQIKRRYVGYWCFIKGRPTYINGPYYFFLNFWKLKNKNRKDSLPDYRKYQRDIFTAYLYAHTTDEEYFKHRVVYRDENSERHEALFNDFDKVKEFERELSIRDLPYVTQKNLKGGVVRRSGQRSTNGINFISGRRVAKTESACCFGVWVTTGSPEQLFVIQGLNKDQAVDKVFVQKIQVPFSKLPFFFRPYIRGKEENKQGFTFLYDGDMSAAQRAGVVPPPLGSRILPLSSNERAADGEETNFVYIDEPGKELDKGSQERDVPSLWYEVLKPASEIGSEIVGTCIMPTTVGDMESGGGEQFLRLVKHSHFTERGDHGRTLSGLINIFMNGYYAIPGFIDKWGDTVIETPKEPIPDNKGGLIKIGARDYHSSQVAMYERNKDFTNLNKFLRNYPPNFRSAFSLNIKGMGMTEETMTKMKNRLSDLKFSKVKTTAKIDFKWTGPSEEVFTDIHDIGRWTYSYIPPKENWNKKTVVREEDGFTRLGTKGPIFAPHSSVANKFILCFDPVKYDKMNRRGEKSSTPTAAIYYKRDLSLDPDSKPRDEWSSQDYVAFIRMKTDFKDEIYEEILKAAILYGAYIYPEANDADDFFQWIRKKGYDGYLLKDVDDKGVLAKVPGVWADGNSKQDMIQKMSSWFAHNVNYMKIPDIIEDWLAMRGIDDLTNHDLAAATGWCQVGDACRTGELWQNNYQESVVEDSPDFF